MKTLQTIVRDQSKKFDAGKPMMELIPTSAYYAISNALTYGASIHGPNTWQTISIDRWIGALLRHLCLYLDDPKGVDAESGLPHTAHLLANACFINHLATQGDRNES